MKFQSNNQKGNGTVIEVINGDAATETNSGDKTDRSDNKQSKEDEKQHTESNMPCKAHVTQTYSTWHY